ncbi:MAG: universal stress protein [Cyclobacteriaceae bacterium]|jgi:nucleotide-binding universal stress UspA family protein|nr:universal stress protein [Cyclobacteriaceae bacterium]
MLHILVPTDFSELSKVAIRYALSMAKKTEGKVTLLHVIDTGEHAASMRLRLYSLIDELVKIAEEDFQQLLDEIKKSNKTGKPIKHEIIQSTSFVDAVSKYARKIKAGIIIMGTHGASGLKKVVMGSNTASMLEASTVPVLAIPSEATFKSLKSVVYATDLSNTQKEFKSLLSVVKDMKPMIHIIHVTNDRTAATEAEMKIDKVVSKSGYKNVLVRVLINNDPVPAINDYVTKIKVDMLTMFPHHYSFFEKLLKRSVTKQLTYQNSVPLLAFKQK